MGVKLLRHNFYDHKPWNNGGGMTRDVWLWPEATSQDGFDIRLSLASIDADGPFSAFPEIDRTITLVEGNPFVLVFDGTRQHKMEFLQPISFDSAQTPSSRLDRGSASAFNVMTRRACWSHEVSIVRGGGRLDVPLPKDAIAVCHAVQGNWQVGAGEAVTADISDSVIVQREGSMQLETDRTASAVMAVFQPVRDRP